MPRQKPVNPTPGDMVNRPRHPFSLQTVGWHRLLQAKTGRSQTLRLDYEKTQTPSSWLALPSGRHFEFLHPCSPFELLRRQQRLLAFTHRLWFIQKPYA